MRWTKTMPPAAAILVALSIVACPAPAAAVATRAATPADRLNERELDRLRRTPPAPVLQPGLLGPPLMQQTVQDTHIPEGSAPRPSAPASN